MITNRPEVLSMFQCVWVPLLPLHILKRMLLANYHRKQPLHRALSINKLVVLTFGFFPKKKKVALQKIIKK